MWAIYRLNKSVERLWWRIKYVAGIAFHGWRRIIEEKKANSWIICDDNAKLSKKQGNQRPLGVFLSWVG